MVAKQLWQQTEEHHQEERKKTESRCMLSKKSSQIPSTTYFYLQFYCSSRTYNGVKNIHLISCDLYEKQISVNNTYHSKKIQQQQVITNTQI